MMMLRRYVYYTMLMAIALSLVLCSSHVIDTESLEKAEDMIIFGYYEPSSCPIPIEKVRFDSCTHVAHCFEQFDARTGAVSDTLNHERFISIMKSNKCIPLLSIGGGHTGRDTAFREIMKHAAQRKKCITNVITMCHRYGYAGVDIDYESPASVEDAHNLIVFMQELRSMMNAQSEAMLLTIDTPIRLHREFFSITQLAPLVDYINVMAYLPLSFSEESPSWHVVYGQVNVLQAVDFYTNNMPRDKLLLGCGLFGFEFTPGTTWDTAVFKKNYELINKIQQGWRRLWDASASTPYLVSPSGKKCLTYEDEESLMIKANYVQEHGLGGMAVWALGWDSLENEVQPCFTALGALHKRNIP